MNADDEGVWCRCKGRMLAEKGRRFPGRREWLWWRCEVCGAVDAVTPLPLIRGGRPGDMANLQSDPGCNVCTTAPSGSGSERESSRATLIAVP